MIGPREGVHCGQGVAPVAIVPRGDEQQIGPEAGQGREDDFFKGAGQGGVARGGGQGEVDSEAFPCFASQRTHFSRARIDQFLVCGDVEARIVFPEDIFGPFTFSKIKGSERRGGASE